MTKTPMATRFWRQVVRGAEAQCWLWDGYKNECGYGVINDGHKNIGAHRASWIIHRGAVPAGLHVLHHCDVPACVNPAHFFLGTHYDNMTDMHSKGRRDSSLLAGSRNGRARLTEADVIQIRAAHAAGRTRTQLVRDYGVGRTAIYDIVHGRKWKHILGRPT